MSATAVDLIPPSLRPHLARLRLSARMPPPSGPLGHNASRARGQGLEFSQYRAYEHGDEPRHIDWKLYARSDRYFVRESQSEAGLSVWVTLDCSASMLQADVAAPSRSKFDAARALGAAVIEIALRQGDRFGLLCIGQDALEWVPLGRGPQHRNRCALVLMRRTCGGAWPALAALRGAWSRIDPAAVVVGIGDGFDPAATQFALQLAATRRDVRSIALTCVDERDFELRGPLLLEDPETGARLETDGAQARDDFRASFQAARAALARELAAGGVRHVEHVLDQPLERPLRAVLA
jgi:uncharacterized protein (DUF58 family)